MTLIFQRTVGRTPASHPGRRRHRPPPTRPLRLSRCLRHSERRLASGSAMRMATRPSRSSRSLRSSCRWRGWRRRRRWASWACSRRSSSWVPFARMIARRMERRPELRAAEQRDHLIQQQIASAGAASAERGRHVRGSGADQRVAALPEQVDGREESFADVILGSLCAVGRAHSFRRPLRATVVPGLHRELRALRSRLHERALPPGEPLYLTTLISSRPQTPFDRASPRSGGGVAHDLSRTQCPFEMLEGGGGR